jgi:hypothetical protein
VPQHEILLLGALVPIDAIRRCSRVCNEEFGGGKKLVVFTCFESHNLYTFVHSRDIYTFAKYPIYLHVGVVLQDIFAQIAGITAILLEVVSPAHNSARNHAQLLAISA